MRSKLYIIMPVLLLLALLAYPVLQIFYEAEENPYLVEIVETSTNTDKSICRWGLCRGKNGAIPEVAQDDVNILLSGGGLYLGDINENKMYLTFDEGYENGYTEDILDTLKQENVKAIFFITGANSHFLRTAGPYFPDSPGHIKRTAWDISRAEGTPPY